MKNLVFIVVAFSLLVSHGTGFAQSKPEEKAQKAANAEQIRQKCSAATNRRYRGGDNEDTMDDVLARLREAYYEDCLKRSTR